MVYYFTSKVVEPAGFIYVGKDKFESMIYTQAHFAVQPLMFSRGLRLDDR